MKKIIAVIFLLIVVSGCAKVEITRNETIGEDTTDSMPEEPAESEETTQPEEPTEPEEPVEPEEQAPEQTNTTDESDFREAGTFEVVIGDGMFDPEEITIQLGDTVTWKSDYDVGFYIAGPKKMFNEKIFPGETYSYTFEERGEFTVMALLGTTLFGDVIVE